MQVTIEHVEHLTLDISGKSATPSPLFALMAGLAASVGMPDSATGKPAAATVQTSAHPGFAALKIGERSEQGGGIYAGVSRGLDGEADGHLFLLDDKPDGKMDWKAAVAWAQALGNDARLPTRFESALLYANLQDQLDTEAWHWTGTQSSDDYAWIQHFGNGGQGNDY